MNSFGESTGSTCNLFQVLQTPSDQSIASKLEANTEYIYCDSDAINLFLQSTCNTA
jgi:hypothetical protein